MVKYNNIENRIGTNVHFHRRIQEKSIKALSAESGLTFETISGIEDFSQTYVTNTEVKAIAGALKIKQERLFDACPCMDPSERADECMAKRIAGQVLVRYPGSTNAGLTGEAKNKIEYGRELARQLKK